MSLVVIYAWVLFILVMAVSVRYGLLWDDDPVQAFMAKQKTESIGTWRFRMASQAVFVLPLIGRVLGWW